MDAIPFLIADSAGKVWISLTHNWPYLLVSVLIAAALKLFTDLEKISTFLIRHKNAGVISATAAAVGTPLCSCGTTAVVLGMMASMIPWAPIVAFMVASPLSSPEGIVYSAGLFGWPFAIYYFVTSIILGLAGGVLADFFEKRGWLTNQNRMNTFKQTSPVEIDFKQQPGNAWNKPSLALAMESSCDCGSSGLDVSLIGSSRSESSSFTIGSSVPEESNLPVQPPSTCGCSGEVEKQSKEPITVKRFVLEVVSSSKQLLIMFLGFAFIGFFLNSLIPEAWIEVLFGSGKYFNVPLAAIVGIPFYINSEGSLPLISSLIQGGMNQGAAMAFLITGAGTSLGAVTGMLTIARWRVVGLVVGTLLIGSIIAGYGFNLLIAVM